MQTLFQNLRRHFWSCSWFWCPRGTGSTHLLVLGIGNKFDQKSRAQRPGQFPRQGFWPSAFPQKIRQKTKIISNSINPFYFFTTLEKIHVERGHLLFWKARGKIG